MKNKKLLVAVGLIAAVLVMNFFMEKNQQTTAEKKVAQDIPTVGVLQFVSHPALDTIYQGVQDGLKEKGYDVSKKQVKIAFQNGQADQSKLSTMSQQLIDQKPDVLVGIATPAAQSLANLTTEIPIVLGAVTDPVAAGLVKDNQKPGGNITGVSDQAPLKSQFELAKKILPKAKTVAILHSSVEDNATVQAKSAEQEAKKLGYEVKLYPIPSENEISQTIQSMNGKVDFIYVPTDNTMANAMQTIVEAANNIKVPVIPAVDTMVVDGGLATISIDQYQLGVESGKMAADIIDGKSKPADTPIFIFDNGKMVANKKQLAFFNIELPEEIQKEVTYVDEGDAK